MRCSIRVGEVYRFSSSLDIDLDLDRRFIFKLENDSVGADTLYIQPLKLQLLLRHQPSQDSLEHHPISAYPPNSINESWCAYPLNRSMTNDSIL